MHKICSEHYSYFTGKPSGSTTVTEFILIGVLGRSLFVATFEMGTQTS